MLKAAGFHKAVVPTRSRLIEVPEIRQGGGQIAQHRAVRILCRERGERLPMCWFLQTVALLKQVAGGNEFTAMIVCHCAQPPPVQDCGGIAAFFADSLLPFRKWQRKPVLGTDQVVPP